MIENCYFSFKIIIIYGGYAMKKYLFTLIPFFIGVSCMVTYNIIGQEVAPDGTLVEPFFLIPLSYLFIAIGIVVGLSVSIVSFYRNTKKA